MIPGLVATHSQGKSWIGREYAGARWLEVLGYQSGHNAEPVTVQWIANGPVSEDWAHLRARPLINMEPVYEQSGRGMITPQNVRNARCVEAVARVRLGRRVTNYGTTELTNVNGTVRRIGSGGTSRFCGPTSQRVSCHPAS